jgi:sugar O-acyltransferase (sialic acid O-acetyltransferase NeuD family)
MHKVIIQGGGVHAQVVLDCLRAAGYNVVALCDPNSNGDSLGIPSHKEYDPLLAPEAYAVVAIGDNSVRKRVVEATKHSFVNAIHPSALLSPSASIGCGNMVMHGAIVQAQSKIGNHVIVNTGSQVDHDCIIGDFVHLAPGAILCGNVQVGEGTLIGAGSTVIQGKKIGKWAIVGAGSVVIDDVPDYTMIVGNPARVIKHLDQREF